MTTCPQVFLFLICFVWWLNRVGQKPDGYMLPVPAAEAATIWSDEAKATSQICLEATKDFLWCQAGCNNPNGSSKMHIPDVSCHYQAIIISSFEESACQSLWHAFSFFQWYIFFFFFSMERIFDRLSYFQCQSLLHWKSVWISLTAKQLSPWSIKVRIKISWQTHLSFWIPCTLGHWCALTAGSCWENRKLMAVKCALGNRMAWRCGISARFWHPRRFKQIIFWICA